MPAALGRDRTPAGEPGPRVVPAHRADHAGSLHRADDVWYVAAIRRGEDARRPVEIRAGIDRDALDLRNRCSGDVPRIVLELEDRADGSGRDDAPGLEVVSAPQRVVLPAGHAAIAECFADVVEVGTFADVNVVALLLGVPLLHDQRARPLVP